MASLRNRISEVCSTQHLPILVSESALLPRQESRAIVADPNFLAVVRERLAAGEPYVGIVGTVVSNDTASTVGALRVGTKAKITKTSLSANQTTVAVDLRGTDSCFWIRQVDPVESLVTSGCRWFHGSVEYSRLPDCVATSARQHRKKQKLLSKEMAYLDALTMFWINVMYILQPEELVHRLSTLGPVPPTQNERTMWIGALIDGYDESMTLQGMEDDEEDAPAIGLASLSMRLLVSDSVLMRVAVLHVSIRRHLRKTLLHMMRQQLRGGPRVTAKALHCLRRSTALTDARFVSHGILPHHLQSGATFTKRYKGSRRQALRRLVRERFVSWGGVSRGLLLTALYASRMVRGRRAVAGLATLLFVRWSDFIPTLRVPPVVVPASPTAVRKRTKRKTAPSVSSGATTLEPTDSSGNEVEVLGEFE